MANTYCQIHIHVIFAVETRQALIRSQFKEELHKYITGITKERGQKMLAIHCMPDHTHLLVGMRPNIALSDLVRDIKQGSSHFINEKRWIAGRFSWQEGFGAFSYSRSQIPRVIAYIQNQEKHHARKTFREEYIHMLDKFQVDYDERFIFKDI